MLKNFKSGGLWVVLFLGALGVLICSPSPAQAGDPSPTPTREAPAPLEPPTSLSNGLQECQGEVGPDGSRSCAAGPPDGSYIVVEIAVTQVEIKEREVDVKLACPKGADCARLKYELKRSRQHLADLKLQQKRAGAAPVMPKPISAGEGIMDRRITKPNDAKPTTEDAKSPLPSGSSDAGAAK